MTDCNENIRDTLAGRGYKILSLEKHGPHIVGVLRKKFQRFFLKYTTNADAMQRLNNEIAWNNQVNSAADRTHAPFHTPTVFDTGIAGPGLYTVFEWFDDNTRLGTPATVRPGFALQIPRIVAFLGWLRRQQVRLPNDVRGTEGFGTFSKSPAQIKGMILKLMTKYERGLNCTFTDLTAVVQSTRFHGLFLAHVEVKPAHLYNLSGRLGIIDAEWASNNIPSHYDIVSCYARVFARARAPNLAAKMLEQYMAWCRAEGLNLATVREQIRGLLAWRAAGTYRDIWKSGKINRESRLLMQCVLDNSIPGLQ